MVLILYNEKLFLLYKIIESNKLIIKFFEYMQICREEQKNSFLVHFIALDTLAKS